MFHSFCPEKELNLRPFAYHANALPLSYLGVLPASQQTADEQTSTSGRKQQSLFSKANKFNLNVFF
jgi:hypothetical protein